MKTITLPALLAIIFLNSIATAEPYVFGGSKTNFSIGPFQVTSCTIVIPDLGVSNESVSTMLSQKGYRVIVADAFYEVNAGRSRVLSSGNKTLYPSIHNAAEYRGNAYLESEVTAGIAVVQTKLTLKVIGEVGLNGLYESNGYDFSFGSDHSDMYDASEIPNCVTKK